MNTVDVAVATPTSQMMFSRSIAGIGVPGTSIDPSIGMTVVKSGRTTGITTGKISDTDLTVTIDYGTSPSGELNATFDDTILISGTGFSAGGDSGSRVMKNSSTHETVGLLFAGGSNSTIICKAKNIESQMGVRF
jgi:hypothetical protein